MPLGGRLASPCLASPHLSLSGTKLAAALEAPPEGGMARVANPPGRPPLAVAGVEPGGSLGWKLIPVAGLRLATLLL